MVAKKGINHNLICITIDVDPDFLSGKIINRNSSSFNEFSRTRNIVELINSEYSYNIPITWFVRIDNQINEIFGSHLYLIKKYSTFWTKVSSLNHEIAWHPHLYKFNKKLKKHELSSEDEAIFELENLWKIICDNNIDIHSFRMGEAWHTKKTLSLIESFDIKYDSSAIPGISIKDNIFMNWEETKNSPYYPHKNHIQIQGQKRRIFEIPMTTWKTKAPYDLKPRLRYINPCVKSVIFKNALKKFVNFNYKNSKYIPWVLISHPDEIMKKNKKDLLYGHDENNFIKNIKSITNLILKKGETFEFCTVKNLGQKLKNI